MSDSIDPMDPLLNKIVGAASTVDGQPALEILLTEHALPIIDSVVRRRARGWRGIEPIRDEVRGEVMVRLLNRLRTTSAVRSAAPISSFRDYVAVMTSRVFDDLVRRQFPRRAQLKNRLRYLIRHDRRFVWTINGEETMCGLAEGTIESAANRSNRMHSADVEALAQQVIGILERDSPCEMDMLVNRVAEATGIVDERHIMEARLDTAAAPDLDPLSRAESMESLRRLWSEIVALPPKQRAALLLNLRDDAGGSPLALLPMLGIASIREIAALVGFADDAFFALWNELPLQDADLAQRLFLTRQQVINLRKSARERLSRRMARMQKRSER